jgi:hypothetical protein
VTDFGLARLSNDAEPSTASLWDEPQSNSPLITPLTAAGLVMGTPGYMAPEQARGEPSTPASDRYALACVAFELLTGRRPFERDNPTVEATAHATEAPPSPRETDPGLPTALDAVFARGLAKRPAERYASCAALVADLRDALARHEVTTATVVARPPVQSSPPVARHASRPRGAAVLLAVVGLLGAGAALAWALTGVGEESRGSTVVLTQTVAGDESTVVVTQTVEGETIERTVTEGDGGPPPEPAGDDGVALNDRGFELLQAGSVEAALPVLEAAVAALSGSSSIAEAYASYNLAVARFSLERCDGVAELLDRSEQVQGERKEIDRLRKQVEKRCDED